MLFSLRKNIRIKLLIIILSLISGNLISQENLVDTIVNRIRSYGVYTGLNFNIHNVDFTRIPGYPLCCPEFESGFGIGGDFGGNIDFYFYDDMDLQIRMGYNNLSGLITKIENHTFGIDGEPLAGEFEYTIDSEISLIDISILATKPVYNNIDAIAGLKFGFPIQTSFEQKEEILNSGDGVFKDTKSKIRNKLSGEITGATGFMTFITAGLRYTFPMNTDRTLLLHPEILFDFGINSFHSDSSWYIISPRIGVALAYYPQAEKPFEYKIEQKEYIDTIDLIKPLVFVSTFSKGISHSKIDSTTDEDNRIIFITEIIRRTDTIFYPMEYKLEASIRAVGVDDGVENLQVTMQVREYSYYSMRPLLNYIFFDENSSTISSRYELLPKDKVSDFNLEKIYESKTLTTYYQLLNIIGYRLKLSPKSNVILTGCNSNKDDETGNLELSENRAKSVYNYFKNNWNIDSSRIQIKIRNLPDKPSPTGLKDGVAENRRVEISSDDENIISPIFINDTLRETTPSTIRFYPRVLAEAGISKWNLNAFQNGVLLENIQGEGTVPDFIDWKIDLEKNTIPKFSQPLAYTLDVQDLTGKIVVSDTNHIPLEQITIKTINNRIGNKLIEHFSLILFDFDEVNLNQENVKIKDYIKSRIKENSELMIAGYTDRMGDAKYNEKLSQTRANNLAKALGQPLEFSKGLGESILLYDNNLPEGRFYSRTVEVMIETPLENNDK